MGLERGLVVRRGFLGGHTAEFIARIVMALLGSFHLRLTNRHDPLRTLDLALDMISCE
jgi:hypothetical protein